MTVNQKEVALAALNFLVQRFERIEAALDNASGSVHAQALLPVLNTAKHEWEAARDAYLATVY